MAVPVNILQTVQTYQLSGLAFLQNLNCFVATSNTKFKDFDKLTAQLGDTVGFDLPPQFTTTNSLVVNFQPSTQRVHTLTVDFPISVGYAFTAQQFIFNVRDYMEKFGRAAIIELSGQVESYVAQVCEKNTYRFFGDGVTPITEFGQLGQALAFFRNYGSVQSDVKAYLSDMSVSSIVDSGLNQFALDRNNKIAMSWQVGRFNNCDFYQSNLLPVHTSGTVGNTPRTLVVHTIGAPNPDGSISTITFDTNPALLNDVNAIKQFDSLQFSSNTFRYLTFTVRKVSQNPVQISATADAASDGAGLVTVTFTPALQALPVANQNINRAIAVGMVVSVLPSHRCGLITGGNPLMLAMPQLPDQDPFKTANEYDPETGVSIRQYFGSRFAQNQQGMVHDCIVGRTLIPEYAMKIAFPL